MQISAHPAYTGSLLQRNRPDPPLMSSETARGVLPAMMIPAFPLFPHSWIGHLPDFIKTAIDCSREWNRTQYPFWFFFWSLQKRAPGSSWPKPMRKLGNTTGGIAGKTNSCTRAKSGAHFCVRLALCTPVYGCCVRGTQRGTQADCGN